MVARQQNLRVLQFLCALGSLIENQVLLDVLYKFLQSLLLDLLLLLFHKRMEHVYSEILHPQVHAVCIFELEPVLLEESDKWHHFLLMFFPLSHANSNLGWHLLLWA